jgi:C-terminal processing protease CtpA/Prc
MERNLQQKQKRQQQQQHLSENARILQLQGLVAAATQREKAWLQDQNYHSNSDHQKQFQALAEQLKRERVVKHTQRQQLLLLLLLQQHSSSTTSGHHRHSDGHNDPSSDRRRRRPFKYVFDEPYSDRLGLIIQSDERRGPLVHGIRESSPLAGLVRIGDKIVEVDGKDTTRCGLSEIVHLLSYRDSTATTTATTATTATSSAPRPTWLECPGGSYSLSVCKRQLFRSQCFSSV